MKFNSDIHSSAQGACDQCHKNQNKPYNINPPPSEQK